MLEVGLYWPLLLIFWIWFNNVKNYLQNLRIDPNCLRHFSLKTACDLPNDTCEEFTWSTTRARHTKLTLISKFAFDCKPAQSVFENGFNTSSLSAKASSSRFSVGFASLVVSFFSFEVVFLLEIPCFFLYSARCFFLCSSGLMLETFSSQRHWGRELKWANSM